MDHAAPDPQYISMCWGGPDKSQVDYRLVLDQRGYITQVLVPEIIGFTVYTMIFGKTAHAVSAFFFIHSSDLLVPSLLISLLCLYYLFKNRKGNIHAIVTGFSVAISSYNCAIFALRWATIIAHGRLSTCPNINNLGLFSAFIVSASNPNNSFDDDQVSPLISDALIPIFLWISDAFLVCYNILLTSFLFADHIMCIPALPCLGYMDRPP
jgi:hypothetical protein